MTYQAGDDICLGFWATCYEAGWMEFPLGARVLELGCAEADWQTPMLALRPDLQITGVDWRPIERPGTTIQGNILAQDFGPAAFDAIVAVSCLEWIGVGHYPNKTANDPVVDDGDRQAMARCAAWLTPGGWLYLDVPHRPKPQPNSKFAGRGYSDAMVADRLVAPHFQEVRRQLFQPNHPDGPYIALLLHPV